MKKFFAILLLLAICIGIVGCAPSSTNPPALSAQPTAEEATDATVSTGATEPTAGTTPTTGTEPTAGAAPTEPEAPTSPSAPEVPAESAPTEPEAPAQPAPAEQESPAGPITQVSSPPSSNSTPSGRPTSSATCRDTGSNEIWPDPYANAPDYYEETDPERTAYLNRLRQEGNEYFFFMTEPQMRMYLGRTYGIPMCTSYEIAIGCSWTSSNPEIATVNQYGFVTPLREGEVIITATFDDVSRQCIVSVCKEPAPYTFAQLEELAKVEAKKIADNVMNDPDLHTDLERIAKAARIINEYVAAGTYSEYIPGYNQPFGTLVTGYSSCAGSTRAMGLVLEYMGFDWYHQNANQWTHQWCIIYGVDGKTAFADGSEYGVAGYGAREDGSNWVQYIDNVELVKPFPITANNNPLQLRLVIELDFIGYNDQFYGYGMILEEGKNLVADLSDEAIVGRADGKIDVEFQPAGGSGHYTVRITVVDGATGDFMVITDLEINEYDIYSFTLSYNYFDEIYKDPYFVVAIYDTADPDYETYLIFDKLYILTPDEYKALQNP